MRYEQHIAQFVSKIQREFGSDFFEWIDAPEGKDVDLNHMDVDELNKSLFEIDVAIHVSDFSEEELDNIHDDIIQFSKEERVSVDLIEANDTLCVYKFSLHSRFLDVNN